MTLTQQVLGVTLTWSLQAAALRVREETCRREIHLDVESFGLRVESHLHLRPWRAAQTQGQGEDTLRVHGGGDSTGRGRRHPRPASRINEPGGGSTEALGVERNTINIGVSEKGPTWLTLRARGRPGHGGPWPLQMRASGKLR